MIVDSPSPQHREARRRVSTSRLLATALVATLPAAPCLANQPPGATFQDLPLVRQAAISAGLGADDARYHAREEGDGFRLDNQRHRLSATITAEGMMLDRGTPRIGLRLEAWGCDRDRVTAGAPRLAAERNRLELQREGVVEWYVNGPAGIEQGFTFERPLAGCAEAATLELELAARGTLSVEADGRTLLWADAGVRARGLQAFDAAGRELSARFTLDGPVLSVEVVTENAQWPVIVDPFFEDATLLASDAAAGDRFGFGVAISGDTIVVGAYWNDDNGSQTGSAYVFVAPPGGWNGVLTESAKLLGSDSDGGDWFGAFVAIYDDTVVVGAPHAGTNSRGQAYVFVRPPGGWSGLLTEDALLLPTDPINFGDFGTVAISGQWIVVGNPLDDDNGAQSGSAYLFTRPPGGWSGTVNETVKLLPSDGAADDRFGHSVAVTFHYIVVGAPLDDDQGTNSGIAYVFLNVIPPPVGFGGPAFELARLVRTDGAPNDGFGFSVAIEEGDKIVVGTPSDQDVGIGGGSAYVFLEPGGGWDGDVAESAKLLPAEPSLFGWSVALAGSRIAIGAPSHDVGGVANAGAVYVFTEPPGGWAGTLQGDTWLVAADGATNDQLGISTGIYGSTIVGGADSDDGVGADSGSARVFAAEIDVVFSDGFESGDTSAWSSVVP